MDAGGGNRDRAADLLRAIKKMKSSSSRRRETASVREGLTDPRLNSQLCLPSVMWPGAGWGWIYKKLK